MVFYHRLMVSLAVVKSLLHTRRIIRRNTLQCRARQDLSRSRFPLRIVFLRHVARRSFDTATKTVAHRSITASFNDN